MRLYELLIIALTLVLVAAVWLAAVKQAKPADALGLDGRTLVMVEGYGARCAVLFNDEGMGSAGSGAISCPGTMGTWSYSGDWRRVQPKGD